MKIRRRSIMASTDKDYASLRGIDFKKARDILTKDGFHEHEYGDKDDNNGYAVYRKGDKEVELTYEWVEGKRKGEAHAGKVTNVYVDDNINSSCGKKSVKASNEGRSDLIYVIMVNGDPIAKGSYDAMVKKSYTYNYPVQMLKFPKAKLNSLMKMAKDAHRPDPLKFAVNRFINDYTDEYDSLNASCTKKSIKASTKIEWEVVDDCTDDDGTIGCYGTKVDGKFYWVTMNENGKWDIEKEYSYGIASLGSKFENFKTAKAAQRFFENYIDDLAEEDDDDIESACGKKSIKSNKRRPVKAARTLDIYTWEDLTPEQQDYVIANWSDMRKLAEVIYEWYNDDIMFAYQEEKQYIADKYANQYGLSINPDKLYWQSNSQGPYPEWDLSQVFDEYQLNDGTEIYFYGRGLDVEAETDSWGEEVESPEIDEVVGHAQEYIDEMWGYINDVCQSYPDDEWVRDTMDANPDSFEFTISENGEVRYF